MVTSIDEDRTEAGNYFIANYPPFSFWSAEHLRAIEERFTTESEGDAPLGLYLHIPFCRKRCKFCYFKVYTDVNAAAIEDYVASLAHEVELVAHQPAVRGRPIRFVYFGGGTPSFLSARQLGGLVDRLRQHIDWDTAEEVTFECEPGTLSLPKLQAIREIGVTRLSLGVEHFHDPILEENGRAHLSHEIYRAWEWIKSVGFPQTNIDLIAGMVGETWEHWRACIAKAIELGPDSITIYQMELPYNTRYVRELHVIGDSPGMGENGGTGEPLVANWSTKRAWVAHAYEALAAAGYEQSSAYTLVRKRAGAAGQGRGGSSFAYRDRLWRGADLLGTGVASFGHLAGIHYQNVDTLERYQEALAARRLPLGRAYPTSETERLIRELILQMKLGHLDPRYFQAKFAVDICERFAAIWADYQEQGWLTVDAELDEIRLTREGLLRVDSLLPAFFLPEHRTERYA